MYTWILVLAVGLVLIALARWGWPGSPAERLLYLLGVVCVVIAIVLFVVWLVAELKTGRTVEVDGMRAVLTL